MKERKRFWMYDIYTLIVDGRKLPHRMVKDYWLAKEDDHLLLRISFGMSIHEYCIDTFDQKKKAVAQINYYIRNVVALTF